MDSAGEDQNAGLLSPEPEAEVAPSSPLRNEEDLGGREESRLIKWRGQNQTPCCLALLYEGRLATRKPDDSAKLPDICLVDGAECPTYGIYAQDRAPTHLNHTPLSGHHAASEIVDTPPPSRTGAGTAPTGAVPVHLTVVNRGFPKVPLPSPPPATICGHFVAGLSKNEPFEGCSYFNLRYEANATRGDKVKELSNVVASPLVRLEEKAPSPRAHPMSSSALVASEFWRAHWDSSITYSYEGDVPFFPDSDFWKAPWDAGPIKTGNFLYNISIIFYLKYELPPAKDTPMLDERHVASGTIVPSPLAGKWPRREKGASSPSAAVPVSKAVVPVGFWRKPGQPCRDFYQDPAYSCFRLELSAAQDAPTRGGRQVEPGAIVPSPLAGKGPHRDEGGASSGAAPVSKSVVSFEFWRAPWNASIITGDSEMSGKEVSMSPPPSTISNHVARVETPRVNPVITSCPLVGSLAACGLVVLALVCRRRFRQRRDKHAAIVLHALARGGLARRHLRYRAEVVCGVQAVWRGRVAVRHYCHQQRRAVFIHRLAREWLVRRRLHRLALIVRCMQDMWRGRAPVRHYRKQQRAGVILHALARGWSVRRRLRRYYAKVVCGVQARRRGRVAVRHYRHQQSGAVILHRLARGWLVRRRLHRLALIVRSLQDIWRGRAPVRHYRQQKRAAVIFQALARGGLVRRRLYRLAKVVRGVQARRRGCVAVRLYRQQQRAAVIVHALVRGMLVRQRIYLARVVRLQTLLRGRVAVCHYRQLQRKYVILHELARRVLARRRLYLAKVVRVQARRRGCVAVRHYRQQQRAAVIVHALGRGMLVRRRIYLARVVRLQSLWRGRVALCHYRQQQRKYVILHELARRVLKRISVRRSRQAAAAAMAAIASRDAVRQCADAPGAGKGDAGPVSTEKETAAGGAQRSATVPKVGGNQALPKNDQGTLAGGKQRSTAASKASGNQASGRGARGQASGQSVASPTPSPTSHTGARKVPKKTSRRFKGTQANDLLGFTVGEKKNQRQETGLGSFGRREQGPSGWRAPGQASGRGTGPYTASPTTTPGAKAGAPPTQGQRAPGQGSGRGVGSYKPPPTTTPGAKAGVPPTQGQRAPGQGSGRGVGSYKLPPTTTLYKSSPAATPGAKGGAPRKQMAAVGGARRSAAVLPTPPSIAGPKNTLGGATRGAQLSAAVIRVGGNQPSVSGRPLRKLETLWKFEKPAICDLSRWYDGCRLIINDDGNCFGLSWMTTALVWAAQSRLNTMGFIKQLTDAGKEGGAFCDLGDTCNGYIADLVSYAEGLVGAWEKRPAAQPTTEFGVSMAVGVVRTLRGRSKKGGPLIEGARGDKPLWLKLKWGMVIAARALDVFAAPRDMDEADLVKLRTFGESIEIDVGSKYALLTTAAEKPATVSPSEMIMRPGRGLKFVVGMVVDSIAKRKEPVNVDSITSAGITYAEVEFGTSEDYTGFFSTLAVDQPCVSDLAVLKAGLPHADVVVAAGPLGDALVTEFKLPAASSVATLAVIKEQIESQQQETVADLQRNGTVSKAELDGQEAMWEGATSWSPREKRPRPAGLENKNNRCSINTAVQVLRDDSALRKALMGLGGPPPELDTLGAHLGTLFKKMAGGGKRFVHPAVVTRIYDAFEAADDDVQLDVGEVLMYLLNALKDEADAAENIILKAALRGMTGDTHYVRPCACKNKSRATDPFFLLTVPMEELPSNGVDSESSGKQGDGGAAVHLHTLLAKAYSTQTVKSCPDCRGENGGEPSPDGTSRTPVLADCPDRLMIQLGRFSGNSAERKKLTHLVTVPTVLNAGPYTEAGRASKVDVLYDLTAAAHHTSRERQQGDVEKQTGHYKAFTRSSADTWHRCNDTNVSTVYTSEVLTKNAYILSYAKRCA